MSDSGDLNKIIHSNLKISYKCEFCNMIWKIFPLNYDHFIKIKNKLYCKKRGIWAYRYTPEETDNEDLLNRTFFISYH